MSGVASPRAEDYYPPVQPKGIGEGLDFGTLRVEHLIEVLTPTDVDAQNNTLSAAQVLAGIVVHTSASSGGTVTTDTAANYISTLKLKANGQTARCYYINDGDQTLTFVAGDSVTLADAGQTIGANESALVLIRRTSATAVTMYLLGA